MAKSKNLPKEILVYECDRLEDGTPVYAVAINVDDIPEDADGQKVGVYALNKEYPFRIHRELGRDRAAALH